VNTREWYHPLSSARRGVGGGPIRWVQGVPFPGVSLFSARFLISTSYDLVQTGIGAYTGPLTSYPSFSHRDLPSNQHTPFTIPPNMIHNNPDVYPFFPQPQSYNASAGPSTPAPTPINHYYGLPPTSRASKRDSTSTSATHSQRPTPLNSAHPSPQAMISSAFLQHIEPSSTDQGTGSEPTPNTELDSEDKRARNTLACTFSLSFT